jgi:hypothetical protein
MNFLFGIKKKHTTIFGHLLFPLFYTSIIGQKLTIYSIFITSTFLVNFESFQINYCIYNNINLQNFSFK